MTVACSAELKALDAFDSSAAEGLWSSGALHANAVERAAGERTSGDTASALEARPDVAPSPEGGGSI